MLVEALASSEQVNEATHFDEGINENEQCDGSKASIICISHDEEEMGGENSRKESGEETASSEPPQTDLWHRTLGA